MNELDRIRMPLEHDDRRGRPAPASEILRANGNAAPDPAYARTAEPESHGRFHACDQQKSSAAASPMLPQDGQARPLPYWTGFEGQAGKVDADEWRDFDRRI